MWNDAEFDRGIDMEAYINKRMLEIPNLQEREAYKEIVGSMISKIYNYTKSSYQELEKRVLNECRSNRSNYAIYMTLTNKAQYDPTDRFMHPIIEESVKDHEILCSDVTQALQEKTPLKLYTVFMRVHTSEINRMLRQNRTFSGILKTENREYKGTFCFRRNEEYLDKVKELYYIFETNYQSWTTVCEAYLMKLLDVYLCSSEEIRENDKKAVINEIKVDFEEYAELTEYDIVPLWNLNKMTERTSIYPDPCIDKTNYEHQIFSHLLKRDCAYLVMETDTEITNIRRSDSGDLHITCPVDTPVEWNLYCVDREDTGRYTNKYNYPILSNCCKESFTSDVTEMFRSNIKTKAEMARLLESYPYTDQIRFAGYRLTDSEPENWRDSNYNMDDFVEDEIRTGDGRWFLIIKFHAADYENYLNEDIMSFLVTQVQRLFPEYKCIGELV